MSVMTSRRQRKKAVAAHPVVAPASMPREVPSSSVTPAHPSSVTETPRVAVPVAASPPTTHPVTVVTAPQPASTGGADTVSPGVATTRPVMGRVRQKKWIRTSSSKVQQAASAGELGQSSPVASSDPSAARLVSPPLQANANNRTYVHERPTPDAQVAGPADVVPSAAVMNGKRVEGTVNNASETTATYMEAPSSATTTAVPTSHHKVTPPKRRRMSASRSHKLKATPSQPTSPPGEQPSPLPSVMPHDPAPATSAAPIVDVTPLSTDVMGSTLSTATQTITDPLPRTRPSMRMQKKVSQAVVAPPAAPNRAVAPASDGQGATPDAVTVSSPPPPLSETAPPPPPPLDKAAATPAVVTVEVCLARARAARKKRLQREQEKYRERHREMEAATAQATSESPIAATPEVSSSPAPAPSCIEGAQKVAAASAQVGVELSAARIPPVASTEPHCRTTASVGVTPQASMPPSSPSATVRAKPSRQRTYFPEIAAAAVTTAPPQDRPLASQAEGTAMEGQEGVGSADVSVPAVRSRARSRHSAVRRKLKAYRQKLQQEALKASASVSPEMVSTAVTEKTPEAPSGTTTTIETTAGRACPAETEAMANILESTPVTLTSRESDSAQEGIKEQVEPLAPNKPLARATISRRMNRAARKSVSPPDTETASRADELEQEIKVAEECVEHRLPTASAGELTENANAETYSVNPPQSTVDGGEGVVAAVPSPARSSLRGKSHSRSRKRKHMYVASDPQQTPSSFLTEATNTSLPQSEEVEAPRTVAAAVDEHGVAEVLPSGTSVPAVSVVEEAAAGALPVTGDDDGAPSEEVERVCETKFVADGHVIVPEGEPLAAMQEEASLAGEAASGEFPPPGANSLAHAEQLPLQQRRQSAKKRIKRHSKLAAARRKKRLESNPSAEPSPDHTSGYSPEAPVVSLSGCSHQALPEAPVPTSGEQLVQQAGLIFPSGSVVLESFTEDEMVARRATLDDAWDVGLRFDWNARAVALGAFPTFPVGDPRSKHPFMRRFQSRPEWLLQEVNGAKASNIREVMEAMRRTTTARFVFRRL